MNAIDENTIEFWKQKYEDLNIQFDEFQRDSRELEQELESELKQREDEIKELKNRNHRLINDNDNLKNKLNEINTSTHKQISNLQEDLAKLKAVNDGMQKYIREIEQKNDDLERTNRCAMFSLGEFESKLNEALERNAILESELDEKDELAETVQRLRDEARDLKQELAVRQARAHKDLKSQHSTSVNGTMHNNSTINNSTSVSSENPNAIAAAAPVLMETDQTTETTNGTPDENHPTLPQTTAILNNNLNELNLQQKQQITNGDTASGKIVNGGDFNRLQHQPQSTTTQQQPQDAAHPVTPSLRVAALNLVGDALRKVTSMEARLIATRNLMKESNRDRRSATISSIESTRFNLPASNGVAATTN